ncbi:uncharacterized protein LOC135475036 [Liolophura sinensis]|uniref:uncharacterized protein LOC135475036 n=1 Tax=Liolophura sinensis TaxID=3198878 RepID=UPI0031594DDA
MGTLWSRLWNSQHQYRILIHGLDCAGKTTVLYRLKLGEVVTTIPTIGFNVETLTYKNVSLIAWDLGGRDKARALHRHYYANTQAIILVVDSTDRERLDQAKDELHQALWEDELRDVSLLVMANKQDLSSAMSTDEVKEGLKLDSLRQRDWAIFPTSATKGEGLAEALDWLTSHLGHPDVKSALVNPIAETAMDLKETVTYTTMCLEKPYELIKKWFSPS